ncbi:hypothetical protein P9X10_01075 [Bacillus cereus]|nr:hypothetical protein [Bacillus cereus]
MEVKEDVVSLNDTGFEIGQLVMAVAFEVTLQSPMAFVGTVVRIEEDMLHIQEIERSITVACHKDNTTPLYADLVYLTEYRQAEKQDFGYIRVVLCAMSLDFLSEQLKEEPHKLDKNTVRNYMIEMSKLNSSIPKDVVEDELRVNIGAEFIDKFVKPYVNLNDLAPVSNEQDRNTNKNLN